MQMLSLVALTATAASAVAAGPLAARGTPQISCESQSFADGILTLFDPAANPTTRHVSFSGVRNSKNHQVLTSCTKKSQWEGFNFIRCNSTSVGLSNGLSTAMGGSTGFGILQSKNNPKYCVHANSEYATATFFTAQPCNYNDDMSQLNQYFNYTSTMDGESLTFLSDQSYQYFPVASDNYAGRKRIRADPLKQPQTSFFSFDHGA